MIFLVRVQSECGKIRTLLFTRPGHILEDKGMRTIFQGKNIFKKGKDGQNILKKVRLLRAQ